MIVGLPLGLSGVDTASTEDARAFATELAELVDVPVRLVDERLSTVQAQSELRAAGRSQKNQRGVVDQAAAVILLQHALDSERSQGVEPGHRIDVSGEVRWLTTRTLTGFLTPFPGETGFPTASSAEPTVDAKTPSSWRMG